MLCFQILNLNVNFKIFIQGVQTKGYDLKWLVLSSFSLFFDSDKSVLHFSQPRFVWQKNFFLTKILMQKNFCSRGNRTRDLWSQNFSQKNFFLPNKTGLAEM